MDQQRENELLMHVAAGTDLLTAIAALPRKSETPNVPASTLELSLSAIVWSVVAIVSIVALLLLI
jgi:hypothetical protein